MSRLSALHEDSTPTHAFFFSRLSAFRGKTARFQAAFNSSSSSSSAARRSSFARPQFNPNFRLSAQCPLFFQLRGFGIPQRVRSAVSPTFHGRGSSRPPSEAEALLAFTKGDEACGRRISTARSAHDEDIFQECVRTFKIKHFTQQSHFEAARNSRPPRGISSTASSCWKPPRSRFAPEQHLR